MIYPRPMKHRYTVFISGDRINLCVPSERAILEDGWGDWFNSKRTTKFLEQGIFPNTLEDQQHFLRNLSDSGRLALLIVDKESQKAEGIVSLSCINHQRRSSQIAIVVGNPPRTPNLHALEAMSRMTEHGFEALRLERIWAGQAFPGLAKWNQKLELIGCRTEGISRETFIKGRSLTSATQISCLLQHYDQLKQLRQGQFWLGEDKMMELTRTLPKIGFAELLDQKMKHLSEEYFSQLKLH